MKTIFAFLLPFLLAVPCFATTPTATAPTGNSGYTGPAGSDVMVVICLVLLVAGVAYLAIGHIRSKK